MFIYSIKNEKLGYFNPPFYAENDAHALDYLQKILMADAERALLSLRGDIALYLLGSIDSIKGIIIPYYLFDDEGKPYSSNCFVSDLEEVFESIPKEKIKPELKQADLNRAYEKIEELTLKLAELEEKQKTHKHYRKEILR